MNALRRALVAASLWAVAAGCSGPVPEGPFGVPERSTLQYTPESYPVKLTWGVELPYDREGTADAVIRDLKFDTDNVHVTAFGLQTIRPGEDAVGLRIGEFEGELTSPLGQTLPAGEPGQKQLVLVLEAAGPGSIDSLMMEYTIGKERFRCPLHQSLVVGESRS